MDENRGIRRVHPPAFRAKVAIEAIKGEKTIAQLSSTFGVHQSLVTKWKAMAVPILEAAGFVGKREAVQKDHEELESELYQQIGKLKVQIDWLKKRLALSSLESGLTVRGKVSHIEKLSQLPITTQADLLGVARGSVYYQPAAVSPLNLDLMNRIDRLYTAYPFYGSRVMAHNLENEVGFAINRKRVQRLMGDMGLEAIYPKPNFSKNEKPHPVYPYLLKGLNIFQPNQVWGADITYIRLAQGFLYLVAILDWYSRYVLSWRLSNTLDAGFCVEAAQEALVKNQPDISNTDQGVQFTSEDWLNLWTAKEVQISMDGRGRCMDNIMVERLWRSLKYEEVYLKNYTSVLEARDGISKYFEYYNRRRLHSSLSYQTPETVYFERR